MLVVDAMVTLATWLPHNIYTAATEALGDDLYVIYTERHVWVMDTVFSALMATNAFSTPVIYFIFNKQFRVNTLAGTKFSQHYVVLYI